MSGMEEMLPCIYSRNYFGRGLRYYGKITRNGKQYTTNACQTAEEAREQCATLVRACSVPSALPVHAYKRQRHSQSEPPTQKAAPSYDGSLERKREIYLSLVKRAEELKQEIDAQKAEVATKDLEMRNNITSLLGLKDSHLFLVGFYDVTRTSDAIVPVFHICLVFLNERDAMSYVSIHPSADIKSSTGYEVGQKNLSYIARPINKCGSFYKFSNVLLLSVNEDEEREKGSIVGLSTIKLALDLS